MKAMLVYFFFTAMGLLPSPSALPLTGPITHSDNKEKNVFRCDNGRVQFRSNATLEVIEARSNKMRGVLDPENQSFAWSVEIASFEGFNSPLQREHFNENYLESAQFPRATFSGKIIEKIDFNQNGTFSVRAKGKLLIHGIEQERIFKGQVEVQNRRLHVEANFTVPLTDHNITIPKIVNQKIAEEIAVKVDAWLNYSE